MYFHKSVSLLLIFCCFYSCKQKQIDTKEVKESAEIQAQGIHFQLLDSIAASSSILKDDRDHFFEHISPLDMCLQMRKAWDPKVPRNQILKEYQSQLQAEVSDFTAREKRDMLQLLDSLNLLLQPVKKEWLVDKINLIKLKATSYGPGVFYTREEGIYIPTDMLVQDDLTELSSVMLHEIFHIMSRYNEDFRQDCYALIGFEKVEGDLELPQILKDRLLLNPDGIDMGYSIQLSEENKQEEVKAVPIIYSNNENFLEGRSAFFGYIQFDLFRLDQSSGGNVVVIQEPLGPEVPDAFYPSFFSQIKDNTQYIIHPDEIMADNFMFAIFGKESLEQFTFSERGNQLINDFQKILFVEI